METKLILQRMALVASLVLSSGLNAMQQPASTEAATQAAPVAAPATEAAPVATPSTSLMSRLMPTKGQIGAVGLGVVLPAGYYYRNGIVDNAKYAGNGIASGFKSMGNGLASLVPSFGSKPVVPVVAPVVAPVVKANAFPRLSALFSTKAVESVVTAPVTAPVVQPSMLSMAGAKDSILWLGDKTLGAMWRNPGRSSVAAMLTAAVLGGAYYYFKTPATKVVVDKVAQFDALINAIQVAGKVDNNNLGLARDNGQTINEKSLISAVKTSGLDAELKKSVDTAIKLAQEEYAKLRTAYATGAKTTRASFSTDLAPKVQAIVEAAKAEEVARLAAATTVATANAAPANAAQ